MSESAPDLKDARTVEARTWFFVAGTAAVILTFALLLIDDIKANSTRESDLAETLREIRSAQTFLASREVEDVRLQNP